MRPTQYPSIRALAPRILHPLLPMDRRLENRLKMLEDTLAHFDAHPDAWNAEPPLVRNVATLRDGYVALDDAGEGQAAGDTTGLTQDKTAARAAAAKQLADLGLKVSAFAIETGDADLRKAVDHTAYEWGRKSEVDFKNDAANALDRTEAVLPALVEYKVTAEQISAARTAVARVGRIARQRDTTDAAREVDTDALWPGYSALVPTLAVLDRLVPALVENADFVATYRQVRQIPGD